MAVIEKLRSRTDAADAIIDLAAFRELKIGGKTSELEIAKQLGFSSRTPVIREALALLVRDGVVEQQPQVARIPTGRAGAIVGGRHHEASLRVSSPARPGSRQSVSTKIRTEPPAVLMYSTLPLAIQL